MFLLNVSVLSVAAVCLISLSASKASEVEDSSEVEVSEEDRERCAWTGPTCIDDCRGRRNGYYQSCGGCKIFVRCLWGYAYTYQCPAGQIWDDRQKRCNKTSTTICFCYQERETCKSTGRRCVFNCSGRKDGDYQSCRGCASYASCVGGKIIDYRPCAPVYPGAPPLQWDDTTKQCNYTSRTCVYCYRQNQMEPERLSWSSILKK